MYHNSILEFDEPLYFICYNNWLIKLKCYGYHMSQYDWLKNRKKKTNKITKFKQFVKRWGHFIITLEIVVIHSTVYVNSLNARVSMARYYVYYAYKL